MLMPPHEDVQKRTLRHIGVLTLALIVGWGTVLAYAVHAVVPFNPISLPAENRQVTRTFLPEGWAFFTRDPREERILPFVKGNDARWVYGSIGPHGRPANAFGLDRVSRAQGIELGLLMQGLPPSAWQACSERPEICLNKTDGFTATRNESPHPTLCGDVGIAMQKPVPWAWASSRTRIVMPSRVLRLEVRCE